MFGIGLPELIVIMALALIVVGPEKLPELARSLAKGLVELKRTANTLKESLQEEENLKPWEQIPPDRSPWSDPAAKPGQPEGTAELDQAGAPAPGPDSTEQAPLPPDTKPQGKEKREAGE